MSTTIGSVTINRNPAIGTIWHNERLNQYTLTTVDGGRATYDNGPTILRGTLALRLVAKSEGDSLRTYLTGTAVYGKNSFTITPPSNTDLGSGDGVALTNCYYDGGESLEGILTLTPNGAYYTINLPYWRYVG